MIKVQDVFDYLDGIAPYSEQEAYDNSGLNVGSMDDDVTKILVALDITSSVVLEASECGADLIISHHPVIFKGLSTLSRESPAYLLAKHNISALSVHTNFDKAIGGSSNLMLEKISMNIKTEYIGKDGDFLRVAQLTKPLSSVNLAGMLKRTFGGCVRFVATENDITSIAVCAGAGGDLTRARHDCYFDAIVTGEAKHSNFADAYNHGTGLFVVGHLESELPVVESIANMLKGEFSNVEVITSMSRWMTSI